MPGKKYWIRGCHILVRKSFGRPVMKWQEPIEDVLARRTRALFLDARAAMDMAPAVAHLMAKELKKDEIGKKNK